MNGLGIVSGLRFARRSSFTIHRSRFSFRVVTPPCLPLRGQMEDRPAIRTPSSSAAAAPTAICTRSGPTAASRLRITFTNVAELRPALSPDGGALVFLRGTSLRTRRRRTVWVMNLLSGSERELPLPKGAGRPHRVGWGPGGTSADRGCPNGALYDEPAAGRRSSSRGQPRSSGPPPSRASRSCWETGVCSDRPLRKAADLCVSGDRAPRCWRATRAIRCAGGTTRWPFSWAMSWRFGRLREAALGG